MQGTLMSEDSLASLNSPLVNYALKGLQQCWLPQHGRWSHIYYLDGRDKANISLPRSDVFYTLNVLLGISRLKAVPYNIDVSGILEQNTSELLRLPVAKYAFGMASWAAAELKLDLPAGVVYALENMLSDPQIWWSFRAQDLGMILTGVIAQASLDRAKWSRYVTPLFEFLVKQYHKRSGLFCDAPKGFRRRFGSFASQMYLAFACYRYGEFANDDRAIQIANECVRKLIELQGPNGEWPWLFDAKAGLVLDFYEVYSVHQYGMAPALLECAERHDVPNAREALIKGFKWVLGNNQLSKLMLVSDLRLTIRSQTRKNELHTNKLRILRALRNAGLGRAGALADPSNIQLRLECRSYELGWILWSFGRRDDFQELTHHSIFNNALQQTKFHNGGVP
jgi:hypothetical protein